MAALNHVVRVPLDGITMMLEIRPVYTCEFHLRLWVGKNLLYAAAWVLGCNFKFPSDESEVSE